MELLRLFGLTNGFPSIHNSRYLDLNPLNFRILMWTHWLIGTVILGISLQSSRISLLNKSLQYKPSLFCLLWLQIKLCGLWKKQFVILFALHTICNVPYTLLMCKFLKRLTQFPRMFGSGFGVLIPCQKLKTFYGEHVQTLWQQRLICSTCISPPHLHAHSIMVLHKLLNIFSSHMAGLLRFGLDILWELKSFQLQSPLWTVGLNN